MAIPVVSKLMKAFKKFIEVDPLVPADSPRAYIADELNAMNATGDEVKQRIMKRKIK